MSASVRYELSGDVAILRIDDGKANALAPAIIAAIQGGLQRAEKEAGAVLLTGRPGRFSAGFDLGVFQTGGPDAARRMVAGSRSNSPLRSLSMSERVPNTKRLLSRSSGAAKR